MTQTKLIATLAFTAALGVGAASAADLGARPYTKAPVFVDPIYNWAGFYIGANVGGAWANQQWINSANTTVFGDLAPGQGFRQRGSGVIGGGQMGYNWQAGNYVFGLEGTLVGLAPAAACSTLSSAVSTISSAGAPTGWRPSPAGLVTPSATICFM